MHLVCTTNELPVVFCGCLTLTNVKAMPAAARSQAYLVAQSVKCALVQTVKMLGILQHRVAEHALR